MHDGLSVPIVRAVKCIYKLDAWAALPHLLTDTQNLPRLSA